MVMSPCGVYSLKDKGKYSKYQTQTYQSWYVNVTVPIKREKDVWPVHNRPNDRFELLKKHIY